MIKKVSTILLVIVALAGLAAAVYRQANNSNAASEAPTAADWPMEAMAPAAGDPAIMDPVAAEPAIAQSIAPEVTVTYYTTSVRCAACVRIEEWTQRAVASRFSEEVNSGQVSFRTVYVDNPGNEHYMQDYQLVSKSVVVSESLDGREQDWVNLQDVWLLLRDEQAFSDYVAQAVEAYL